MKEKDYVMMNTGKINWEILQKLLADHRGAMREEVEKAGAVGEDCAVVTLGEERLVLSTDPITAAAEKVGHIAYHININDIATTGAKPLGVLVTILAPPSATMEDIEEVMKEISEEAKAHEVMILGGHTEVTDAVNRLVVSITALGTMKKEDPVVWTSGAEVGDHILVTKKLCLEGTTILVGDFQEKAQKVLTFSELEEAKGYASSLSVLKEGILLKTMATSMHDITEGGILGALWEVKEASGKGFCVEEDKLPVTDVTKKLCKAFHLDPLRLISSGSMLVTVKDGHKALEMLLSNGVEATLIGQVTKGGAVLVRDGQEIFVEAPMRDEIYKLYEEETMNGREI